MIYRISSNLKTFKNLTFKPGLNVLLCQKEEGASEKQTRNRAGKTSLIEIIHFLTGSNADKESIFRSDDLADVSFRMELDIGGDKYTVERACTPRTKYSVSSKSFPSGTTFSKPEWDDLLGDKMFNLNSLSDDTGKKPTFRSLFAYFVRREQGGAFAKPDKQASMQQLWDSQIALLFLLGLDWRIASDWQEVREREKTLAELKKAAGAGAFGSIIGKAADLRTELTVAEDKLRTMKSQIKSFRVLPQFDELEAEADDITQRLNEISNLDIIDLATVRELKDAVKSETPPSLNDLERLYEEAGVILPKMAVKRYDEVRSFHESVIRNRRDYLSGELDAAKQRLAERRLEKQRLDERRAELMDKLQGHGALEQFAQLQGEMGRLEADVETLRKRFESAEQLEGTRNELNIERNRLLMRLRRDFAEQKARVDEAILAFEETSRNLYESAGSMVVEDTLNGPQFKFEIQGSRSAGIMKMQIFCFDMMLMRLCASRSIGTGFLVHDSHLFDGVDGRQIISALQVGAGTAEELGFQYIVTMNEDDAFKEKIEGFDIQEYVLPVKITDATDDGGLFGFRF